MPNRTSSLETIIQKNRVWYCLDCGKCSAVCPITLRETRRYTSPRLLVETAMGRQTVDLLDDPLFWSCLTCKRCSQLCPSNVHFSEFLRQARALGRDEGRSGACTHSDMIHTWARMMTDPAMEQNRLDWLKEDLRVSEDSDTVYFVGCLPYYDIAFENLGFEGIAIARAAVKILNHLGIEPIVLADERCCGHDQLWQGERDTFQRLAELNLEMLQATGARRVVTTCPECARTLKIDYPQFIGDHGLEVLHLTELIAEEGLQIEAQKREIITYQDPCRLGRHLDVYDPPRQAIESAGFQLEEMAHNRAASLCCGTSCWTECGQVSKQIRVNRLEEAKATGAETLATACLKCQIHFRCAQDDPVLGESINIDIRDVTTLVAEILDS